MKVRPLQDRVLAKRIKQDEEVRGGIIIPDSAKEKPLEAEVIAVGPGKYAEDADGKLERRPLDVKAGDRILIGKYSGSDIKIEEEEHVILREDDVLAVIES